VKFALEHVRTEVVELWSGNFKSRVIDDDEPTTRNLPWLISFCVKTTGVPFYIFFVVACASLEISSFSIRNCMPCSVEIYHLHQVNGMNGGDTVFVQCVGVSVRSGLVSQTSLGFKC